MQTRSIPRWLGLCLSMLLMAGVREAPATVYAAPAPNSPPAGVYLDITPAAAGGIAEVRMRFDPADGVRGFNLLMQFTPGGLLSASAGDFQRNAAFFPEISLGTHALNSIRDAGSGRIRIIGLAPTAATGSSEVGSLRLHIAGNAATGASQVVTLTGEVNLADGGVAPIAPVVGEVRVVALSEHIYLPLLLRTR